MIFSAFTKIRFTKGPVLRVIIAAGYACALLATVIPVTDGQLAHALGNHPEAGTCPTDKPYYTFCSHSLHNLEGWFGKCHATREQAQQDAEKHAREQHKGNDRWTGVLTNNLY